MEPIATADDLTPAGRADALASDMQVTFDDDELSSFFDGFAPLEDIAVALLSGDQG